MTDRVAVIDFETHGYEDNLPTPHSMLAAKRYGGSKKLRLAAQGNRTMF